MTDVIQEFLVSIGFKIDDAQRRRFEEMLRGNKDRAEALNRSIGDTGKALGVLGKQLQDIAQDPARRHNEAIDRMRKGHQAFETQVRSLGRTAAVTTAAFIAGFQEIARQYNNLYYISQRTGVSAQQLAGLGFAGSQAGVGDQLIQVQQAIAQAARNPGTRSFIRQYGDERDPLQILQNIAKLPQWQQDLVAGKIGIPSQVMQNVINNMSTVLRAQEEFNKRIDEAGVKYETFIKHSVEITRDFNSLWSSIGVIAIQGFEEAFGPADKFLKKATDITDEISKWNSTHPGAALAENLGAAWVSAAGLLAVLGKMSGLPLLRYGITGSLLYGAYRGATGGVDQKDPTGIAPSTAWDPRAMVRGGLNWLGDAGSAMFSGTHGQPGNPATATIPPRRALGGYVGRSGTSYLHEGETVLPRGFEGVMLDMLNLFQGWLGGNSSFQPFVRVAGFGTSASSVASLIGGGGMSPGGGGGGAGGGFNPAGGRMVGRLGGMGGLSAPPGTGGRGGWGQFASEAIKTMRDAGWTDEAIQGIMANGLGEGGFASQWRKAGGGENSFGHWQFNARGELPGYLQWLQTHGGGDPMATANQTKYVMYRMNQIMPGFGKLHDSRFATDLVQHKFERPSRDYPGMRYGFLSDAQRRMAGLGGADTVAGGDGVGDEASLMRQHGGRGVVVEGKWYPNIGAWNIAMDRRAFRDYSDPNNPENSSLKLPRASLGGGLTHYDAGDRTANVYQTNHVHIHGAGGPGEHARRMTDALNNHAGGVLLHNAKAAIE